MARRKYFENQRLLKLADFLENQVRDKRFNLDIIATTETCEIPSQTACGTAACAIGHMPQVFPRVCKYSEIDPNCLEDYGPDNPFCLDVEGKGDLEGLEDFHLAKQFFGINEEESHYLFLPSSYGVLRGRKTVAARIRKFVKEGRIPKDHKLYSKAFYYYYQFEDAESDELVETSAW